MELNKLELKENGFTIFRNFYSLDFIQELSNAIDNSYELCRSIQQKNGISEVTDGTVHHLLASGDSCYFKLLEMLCSSEIFEFLKDYFNGNFILNTYGGVINLSSKPSYVANIHRDIRFYSDDFPLMINFLIMLDDFTIENGATYLLKGSHKMPNKPTEDYFYKNSDRAIGKKGDILFFNSNVWHAAGINLTEIKRRAITIAFTKPFMKQQLDYTKLIENNNLNTISEELKQILGYFARTPSNLDEWYQKPENRFYRPGQD